MALPLLLVFAAFCLASVPTHHAAESPAEAYWITKLGKDVIMPRLLKDGLPDVDTSNADGKGFMMTKEVEQSIQRTADQDWEEYGKGRLIGPKKSFFYGGMVDSMGGYGKAANNPPDMAHFGNEKEVARPVPQAGYGKAANPSDMAHFGYEKEVARPVPQAGYGKAANPSDMAHFGYEKDVARPVPQAGYGKAANPPDIAHFGHRKEGVRPNDCRYGNERTFVPKDPHDKCADNFFVLYFFEKDLYAGNKMRLHFMESKDKAKFLPVEVAKSMPFSSNKWSEILKLFSVKPESYAAKTMKETIDACEGKMSVKGEEKACTSSLESMIDFLTSRMGSKVEPLSTYIEKENGQEYTIESAKKVGKDDASNFVCHKMGYPYAVFYCHSIRKTDIYSVTLVDAEGKKLQAVAACHKDTSAWNPKHLSMQLLKVKPGTTTVCHFLNEKAVAWVRK